MNKVLFVGWTAVTLVLTVGCSNPSAPPVPGSAPTQTASTPSSASTPKVAIALATPDLAADDLDEVDQSLTGFLHAVSVGNVDKAMTYWSLYQPGQPSDYAANVRKIVTGWVNGKHQFGIGPVTYLGLVAPGSYRAMPRDDPRASHATVVVRIDGADYSFSLIQDKTGWLIEGIVAPGAPPATATP